MQAGDPFEVRVNSVKPASLYLLISGREEPSMTDSCISYDLIRRSVLAVRAVVSVDDGHAAMSFSFAKGSASIRV